MLHRLSPFRIASEDSEEQLIHLQQETGLFSSSHTTCDTTSLPALPTPEPDGMSCRTEVPRRGGEDSVTNSVGTGSLAEARRSAGEGTRGRIMIGVSMDQLMARPLVKYRPPALHLILTLLGHLFPDIHISSHLKDHLSHSTPNSPELKCSFALSHPRLISLYTDRDIGEEPKEDLCSFDHLELALQRRLCALQLLGGKSGGGQETDAVLAVAHSGALEGAAGGDGNTALVRLAILCATRGQISAMSHLLLLLLL